MSFIKMMLMIYFRTALHWACAVGSDRCVAGLLRLGVKHDAVDNYGITPLVYARQLKHETCVSLIGAFNPLRPQDVLIPVESFTKHSNTIEKISHHRASLSNVEQDVFMLVPSCEKDQSNLEKVLRLYENEESLANDHESQPIIVNHEDALNIEIRYSDCDSNWSDDELTSTSQAAHHGNYASVSPPTLTYLIILELLTLIRWLFKRNWITTFFVILFYFQQYRILYLGNVTTSGPISIQDFCFLRNGARGLGLAISYLFFFFLFIGDTTFFLNAFNHVT